MISHTTLGLIGFAWGLTGMCALLTSAIFRLGSVAIAMVEYHPALHHWIALTAFTCLMAYSEGYRGFQRGFSPRFAARLRYLLASKNPLHVVLAPVFCMGFFYTTRRRMISAYALTVMIIAFVVAAQHIPQPWRGIIDAGVVVGLLWGVVSLLYFGFHALTRDKFDHSAHLPGNQDI